MTDQSKIDRRRFLSGALATATTSVAGPSLLAGCGGEVSRTGPDAATRAGTLPTHLPYPGVKPDLPGNQLGLLDGFLRYPDPPARAVTGRVGDGGPVSVFVRTDSPAGVPAGNPYARELNKRLNVDLRLTTVPAAGLGPAFATLVASGDLPDIIEPALNLPDGLPAGTANLPAWLAARCHDLTPLLAGDAVRQYPFLANLPAAAWRDCRFNGRIFGVPVPRGVAGNLMFRRDDLFKQFGVNPDPTTFAEFTEVCKAVSDPRASRWACAQAPTDFVLQMLGAPNRWRAEGGRLVSVYEVEQFKQMLADCAAMVRQGLVHPDSFAANPPARTWFTTGQALLTVDRYTAWPQFYADRAVGPGFDVGGMRPPKYAGGGLAGTFQSPPTNNVTVFKKTDTGRITMLLRLSNWLAAPYGTEEYLFRKFGLPGTHYTMRGGGPLRNQAGAAQTGVGIQYIVDAPDVIFIPGNPAATRKAHAYQAAVIPTSVKDPQTGLYSETWTRRQAQLDTIVNTGRTDILSGRRPVSSWDEVLRAWKRTAGDQVRTEFEEQLARTGG